MNRRTLSSAQTFWLKFIFPTVWISVFGFGMLAPWTFARGNMPPEFIRIVLLAWLGGIVFSLKVNMGLKRVQIDHGTLYISNFRREIAVPLSAVESVTENRWIDIHPVTLHFRVPTEFGKKITFMPVWHAFLFWDSHPVVRELRAAAAVLDLKAAILRKP